MSEPAVLVEREIGAAIALDRSWTRALGARLGPARAAVTRHLAAVSQTFFVHDARVGLAGVVVLSIFAPRLAVCALVASVVARVAAHRAGASRTLLDAGLTELNGWFFGLACGTFFAFGPGLAVALLLGGALAGVLSIAMQRVLATWDLPLLVGPYVPAFWLVWSALSAFPWSHAAVLPSVAATPASALMPVLLGGLRGLGQIFFLPNAALGLALALAVSIADRRLGIVMIVASVASVGVGYALHSPLWQVEQGLAGFTAALVAAAAVRGFSGLGWLAVLIAVVTSPFMEAAALRLAESVGLHALSASYVGLIWVLVLVRPVRGPAAPSSWSMRPRSRSFESG